MAGILDGSLAEQIYKGFKGKLLIGTIRQYSAPESGALDAFGDPIELIETDTRIEGFTEDYDDQYMANAGIPTTDLKVNIFGKSCPGVIPGKDDKVRFRQGGVDTWYQLRRVRTDPAGALYVCQAFVTTVPLS